MTQMMLKITVNILTLPAVICLGLEISVDQGEVEAKVKIYSCVLCRSAQKKYTIYCITIRNFIYYCSLLMRILVPLRRLLSVSLAHKAWIWKFFKKMLRGLFMELFSNATWKFRTTTESLLLSQRARWYVKFCVNGKLSSNEKTPKSHWKEIFYKTNINPGRYKILLG